MRTPFSSLLLIGALAQPATARPVPLEAARWELEGKEARFVEHLGRPAILLQGGAATVKGARFKDGIIEFDVAVPHERGFTGCLWRLQGPGEYENFYIRPHQSGNPDANQYQPVFHGNDGWQLYYGESYSAPVKYDFDQWMHVKVVVAGGRADIYIKDMAQPALAVELKREIAAGGVGLLASNFAPAYYSGYSVEPMEQAPALEGTPKPAPRAPAGSVMAWSVSAPFDGKTLEPKLALAPADKRDLRWTRLAAEDTGIANLGRLASAGPGHDTVFARLTVRSDREQTRKLRFGFSDKVRAYVNDRAVYGGNDHYTSRDYRFLGTIGLWDELYLPLVKGENQVWFAVTEDFGGWGIMAAFDDLQGIEIVP